MATNETSLENTVTTTSENATSWPLRRVGLRVQDLSRSIEYYTKLGLSIVRDERAAGSEGGVGMGVGTHELLSLRPLPGGRPRAARTAGLFHFALLVGDDAELGSFLQHCLEANIPLAGASDHLVSQALYLTDPEGNGIEVYSDRPREQWQYQNGNVLMDTLPLNARKLLEQAGPFEGFSERLRLGHMHLNVGNLDRSQKFYEGLGLNLMVGWADQADFMSWNGYHHHLGLNVWAGRDVAPVEADVYGIDFFELHRPDLAPTTLQDPDGMTIVVV
jgi:catechol 2,3-dioxygenase